MVGYKTRKALTPFCWKSITFPCIGNGLVVDCTSHIIFTNVLKLSTNQVQVKTQLNVGYPSFLHEVKFVTNQSCSNKEHATISTIRRKLEVLTN